MSFAALAWASKVKTDRATDKLILLAYADRHNEETGCAYPSVAWLEEFSSLNRKTVIATVARLEAAGLIRETGERKGATGQIKVYFLNLETVPKTEPSQKRNSSGFSAKQSQKRDTEPVKEPVEPAKAVSPQEQVINAWNAMAGRTGLSPIRTMANDRKVALRQRLTDFGLAQMLEAIERLGKSDWCCGRSSASGTWRANFSFILQPSSLAKLLEGSYDNKGGGAQSGGTPARLLTADEHERMALWYEKRDRHEEASISRQHAARIRGPTSIGSLVRNIQTGVGQ